MGIKDCAMWKGNRGMTRKQKFFLNSGTGVLKQMVAVICGFILPRYILLYYGSDTNGLISSMSNFLGFISLLEMGIGPVIQANLYGPLAQKDGEQISKIIISSERFFRKIAAIFLIYIVILAFVFPTSINTKYDVWFSVSLLVIIASSTFAQYFFGMTYQLLLNADQKAYIQMALQMATTILNTIFCIVFMRLGASIHLVKLLSASIFICRPLGQAIYVRRHYRINKKLKLTEEPIKQKWNGFAQHLAAVVCGHVDVVVLTFFSSLANVSVYSVYFNVTNGVTAIIMTAATGLESLFGNMIAKKEQKTLLKTFEMTELIVHTAVTVIFTIAAITIKPFVAVYTRGITDADYLVPAFGVMLVMAYAAQCLRVPYFRIIKAAGAFKETQNGAFLSAILNVVISVVLVFRFGLVGIALGTFVAMMYHTCYFVWYLKGHILNRSVWYFVYYLCSDILIGILAFFFTHNMAMVQVSYLSWTIFAFQVAAITIGISILVNGVLHGKTILGVVKRHLEKKKNI